MGSGVFDAVWSTADKIGVLVCKDPKRLYPIVASAFAYSFLHLPDSFIYPLVGCQLSGIAFKLGISHFSSIFVHASVTPTCFFALM